MPLIYVIPGLGTTQQLFKDIHIPHCTLKVLEWPQSVKGETLKDYARKFVQQIQTDQPVYLMGVSFGGMLCCEILDMLPVKKAVIISSCKHRNEFPFYMKLLRYVPLHYFFSNSLIGQLAIKFNRVSGFEKEYYPCVREMTEAMPPHYFTRAVQMIVGWNKTQHAFPVYHIHGSADQLLPIKKIQSNHVIQNGSHAMIVYKAQEINVILNKVFNEL